RATGRDGSDPAPSHIPAAARAARQKRAAPSGMAPYAVPLTQRLCAPRRCPQVAARSLRNGWICRGVLNQQVLELWAVVVVGIAHEPRLQIVIGRLEDLLERLPILRQNVARQHVALGHEAQHHSRQLAAWITSTDV